jgi:hypothetical protein
MPLSLGGFEVDPLTTAKVVEEVSRYNTTAGWTLMVANTGRWWCSRLSEEGVAEIFKDGPDTFLAGAFHPPNERNPRKGRIQNKRKKSSDEQCTRGEMDLCDRVRDGRREH